MPSYRVATRNGTLKGRWDNLASSECHNSSDEDTEENVCEEDQETRVFCTTISTIYSICKSITGMTNFLVISYRMLYVHIR